MQYILEIKSQKSVGSGPNTSGGPDRYVAVQCVPEGVPPLKSLQERAARLRGIRIKVFGQGYARNTGPRSALGRAIAKAEAWIAQQDEENY